MLLNVDNAFDYLLNANLVTNKSILDSDLRIIDVSKKNRNIKVIREKDASYLLKQERILSYSHGDNSNLKREGEFYDAIHKIVDFESLRPNIPQCFSFDSHNKILILELIKSQSFLEYCSTTKLAQISNNLLSEIGRILANVHTLFSLQLNNQSLRFMRRKSYPNLAIYQPQPILFIDLSRANLQLLKLIQKYPTIRQNLDAFFKNWKIQTLIHGDLKWDNILISSNNAFENQVTLNSDVKIVDWELCFLGDPAWDIGGFLHDFASQWVLTFAEVNKKITEISDFDLKYALDPMKPLIRSFWSNYIKHTSLRGAQANDLLRRSALACSARLLQKAYEVHEYALELSKFGYYVVQLSTNVMKNLDDAIIHLFGIPFQMEGAINSK